MTKKKNQMIKIYCFILPVYSIFPSQYPTTDKMNIVIAKSMTYSLGRLNSAEYIP